MKNKKRKAAMWWMCLVLLVCLATVNDFVPAQAAVKLNQTAVNLCVGDTTTLKITGTSKKVTWKSSKSSVAKVSSKGKVTAKKAGTATITAKVNKKSYKCTVKVNKTFKVSKASISIKKNTDVTAFLSVNGAVNASVANKKICAVTFGKWDGDYMPLTIVPKKVGTTTITFTNSANNESCTLKVKVTALPSIATYQGAEINTGAESLVVGENTFQVAFKLNRTAAKTYVKFYDESGAVVRSISVGELTANKKKSVVWDGKDNDGNPLHGTYTYAVVADGNKTLGETVNVIAQSPFQKGDGTEDHPYLVSDLNELYLMKNYNGAHFAQDADIDFNYGMTVQVFDDNTPFSGVFEGKYEGKQYRMINLCGYSSVFGSIGEAGTVKNVNLSNCVLNTAGSLLAFVNNGTIDSCTVNGQILCNAGNQAAMLVLYNKGVIRDCTVFGSLNVSATNVIGASTLKAGGIALQNSGTIAACTSSVQIVQQISIGTYVPNITYEIYSGGIVAENVAGAIITKCIFTNTINTNIVLPEGVTEVLPVQIGKFYSGFIAGMNQGYIGNCINASATMQLPAQGTGNGTVQ